MGDRATRRREEAIALAVLVFAALAFVGPGLVLTGGVWPAPLDDVYIHFDFARSTARGHPFEWVVGNGYSSGCTSVLYPFVLAPAWLLGLRGSWLGLWATIVAVASLFDLGRSLSRVVGSSGARHLAAPALVCAPLLDWTLFSGMEVAFALALLGRALAATNDGEKAIGRARAARQRAAGRWLAALALTRPECVVLAPLLAVSVARASGPSSALRGGARAIGPTVAALAVQAGVNAWFTGEASAAGAVRKLVTNDPYVSPIDGALLVLRHVMELRTAGVELALGGRVGASIVYALALLACVARPTRLLAIPLVLGAIGALFLAAVNTTAPFQNMRYAMPTLAMLLVAALLGLDVLFRRGRFATSLAVSMAGLVAVLAGIRFPSQISHFARSSRNIAEQQVVVGERLGALDPPPRRVFLGDAGAIPYFSDRPALDGLGLGGFKGMPFARASVHGVGAVIELIERLPANERPDVLAIYDSWWQGLVPAFGAALFDVTIEDNIICADRTKRVYRADWSLLEPRTGPWLDRLDVGDLLDERAHGFEMPRPHAGHITTAVRVDRSGVRRFDAGRIFPAGREARFALRGAFEPGAHVLVLRSDEAEPRELAIEAGGQTFTIGLIPALPDAWGETRIPLPAVEPGAVIAVRGVDGALRAFAFSLEP